MSIARSLVLAGVSLVAAASFAIADTPAPAAAADTKTDAPAYTILERDVSVPFAARVINGFRVGTDKSLILDGPGGKWYRVQLDSFCRRDLPWEESIGIDSHPTGSLDKFGTILIDGRRCRIESLDRIADPRPSARRAAEAQKGA